MFANLTKKLEGLAVEDGAPLCNYQESAQAASAAVRSFPLPLVSCEVTQTGEATFRLQWESNKSIKILELRVNLDTPCLEVCRIYYQN